jgi:hypothetical protein
MTDDVNRPDRPSNPGANINMGDPGPPASRSRPVESTEGAMDEYRARQAAERAKMARLRALRLAAEAKAGVKQKGAPGGKAKRA